MDLRPEVEVISGEFMNLPLKSQLKSVLETKENILSDLLLFLFAMNSSIDFFTLFVINQLHSQYYLPEILMIL